MSRKLLFGHGYLGSRVAQRWLAAGDEVTVVTRSSEKAAELRQHGYQTIVADVTQRDSLVNLPVAATVLFSVGYDRTSSKLSIETVYRSGVENVLQTLPHRTGQFIYISTIGVYGDSKGEWVDEGSPTNPSRDGGKASLAAEEIIRAHPLGQQAVTLRLAGLYGPNRIPFLEQLRLGQPIAVPRGGHLNLIHVEDSASVVLAAEEKKREPGLQVYCVSDGQPAMRHEFYQEVAHLLNVPEPMFVAPSPDSPRVERAKSDKRISNRKLLKELGVNLSFPSYREGLAAILAL